MPATDRKQFVRKLSGFNAPSKANQVAFDRAIEEVTDAARKLISSLVTSAEPRDRDLEAERARARSAARFPPGGKPPPDPPGAPDTGRDIG